MRRVPTSHIAVRAPPLSPCIASCSFPTQTSSTLLWQERNRGSQSSCDASGGTHHQSHHGRVPHQMAKLVADTSTFFKHLHGGGCAKSASRTPRGSGAPQPRARCPSLHQAASTTAAWAPGATCSWPCSRASSGFARAFLAARACCRRPASSCASSSRRRPIALSPLRVLPP